MSWSKYALFGTTTGVAGLTCGKLYSLLVKYPETVRPILQLSAASGVVGTLLGLGVSAYRSLPTHVYAVSVGANFAIASGVFLGRFNLYMTTPCLIPRLFRPYSQTVLASFPGCSGLIPRLFWPHSQTVLASFLDFCFLQCNLWSVSSLLCRSEAYPPHFTLLQASTPPPAYLIHQQCYQWWSNWSSHLHRLPSVRWQIRSSKCHTVSLVPRPPPYLVSQGGTVLMNQVEFLGLVHTVAIM